MLEKLHLITINHHKLNVNELDNFVIKHKDKDQLQAQLEEIKKSIDVEELMYLTTCNRLVLLLVTDQEIDSEYLRAIFKKINPKLGKKALLSLDTFVDHYNGTGAISHLFEVASSIDSMVVGEREIIRQFRSAYMESKNMGLTGDLIRLVEKYTVQAAKAVYAQTKIGEKPVSIVSLAMKKLREAELSPEARFLIIGAGETNELVSKFLKKYKFKNYSIFNRSLDNAKKLSTFLDAKAYHLSALEEYDEGFDCIIACTGATEAIVTPKLYHWLLAGEEGTKVLIDLAIPNNIDKKISDQYDTQCIDIEQLRILADENLAYRKQEVVHARKILQEHIQNFEYICQQRKIEYLFSDLPQEINAIKHRAIEQVYKKELDKLDPNTLNLVHDMMDYMEKKCVGIPMKVAKNAIG